MPRVSFTRRMCRESTSQDSKNARLLGAFRVHQKKIERALRNARLEEWEALGLAYAIIYFPDPAYDTSSLDLFAREVIPALAG